MEMSDVIDQLKTYAVDALGGRIAGVADFARGLETVTNMPLPCAYVYPLTDEAEPNTDLNGDQQIFWESFAVTVEFDQTRTSLADSRTGFAGVNQVNNMKKAIWKAILNWQPPSNADRAPRGIEYVGGELLSFDRARLFWQYTFRQQALVTDADGFWQVPPDLTDIQVTVADGPGGETLMNLDINRLDVNQTQEC